MLVLVVVAPSKAPTAAASPFASYAGPGGANPGATASAAPTGSLPRATLGPAALGGPASGPALSNTGRPAGDTKHCVNGSLFGQLVSEPPSTPAFLDINGLAT